MLYVIQQKQVHREYNEVIHVKDDDVHEMVFQPMIHRSNTIDRMQICKLNKIIHQNSIREKDKP